MDSLVLYVVVAPDAVRGVYDSLAACRTAVAGRRGVHIETARDADEAAAILARHPRRDDALVD